MSKIKTFARAQPEARRTPAAEPGAAPAPAETAEPLPDLAPDGRPHVVIIGAGFAGLETARQLRNAPVRVTIIDRRNFHLFVPLLYQVATAALNPADIAEPIRRVLRRNENTEVILGEVTGVDPARKQVLLGDRRMSYDYLVIGTGSTHSYFGHQDWEQYAPGLKTMEDAREIRSRVLLAFERAEITRDPEEQKRLMTVAVVGGGPTGVELAGAIAELARYTLARDFRHIHPENACILLIEAGKRILPQFPEDLAAYAHRALETRGVTVKVDAPVENVEPRGVTVAGRFIPAGTILWGAGVTASPAGRWLGVETDRAGRVKVAPDLSVPGLDGVFVLGDTALVAGDDGKPLPGLAQVAKQQGDHMARTLTRLVTTGEKPEPFRFRNRGNLATIGRNSAVADFGRYRLKGFLAWLLWGIVHVYLLIGFDNRLLVSLQWLYAYLTYQRGARLITGERKAPLEGVPGVGQGGGVSQGAD